MNAKMASSSPNRGENKKYVSCHHPKIVSYPPKMGSSSPIFGMKIPTMFEVPPPSDGYPKQSSEGIQPVKKKGEHLQFSKRDVDLNNASRSCTPGRLLSVVVDVAASVVGGMIISYQKRKLISEQ